MFVKVLIIYLLKTFINLFNTSQGEKNSTSGKVRAESSDNEDDVSTVLNQTPSKNKREVHLDFHSCIHSKA